MLIVNVLRFFSCVGHTLIVNCLSNLDPKEALSKIPSGKYLQPVKNVAQAFWTALN